MKEEQTGVMEEEILKEEDQTTTSKKTREQEGKKRERKKFNVVDFYNFLKKAVFAIKRPKIITIFLLFATMLAVYTALSLLAAKKQPEEIIEGPAEISSPSPKTITDPTLLAIKDEVEKFKKEIEKQSSISSDLFPPILDLEISFK